MDRRSLLRSLAAASAAVVAPGVSLAERTMEDIRRMRSRWRELAPAGYEPPSPADRLSLSEIEWSERLSEETFAVLRQAHTEPAFSSPLNEEKRRGLYLCAGCDLPVFTSEMKFESGTGWPSFVTTIPDVFETQLDFVLFIPRTEYHCIRCGGHHGHIFDDGPPPTRERWCNNGLALRFVPADSAG